MSSIILKTDDTKLNQKGCKLNSHLKELCEKRNVNLIDNSKRIKPQHLNKDKLHLKKSDF